MMALLSFLLAVTSFSALALSMGKHHRDLFGHAATRSAEIRFRMLGWVLLSASLIAAIRDSSSATGVVLWLGLLTAAALSVALLLTYRDTWWKR